MNRCMAWHCAVVLIVACVGTARAAEPDKANLVTNGGFEQVDKDTGALVGWTLPAGIKLATDPKAAHTGQNCVKMDPLASADGKYFQNSLNTCVDPMMTVEPGKSYKIGFWARNDGAPDGLVVASQPYWYRADKSYIKHDGLTGSNKGTTEWLESSDTFTAPPEAKYLVFYIYFYGAKGVAYIDDVYVMPVEKK